MENKDIDQIPIYSVINLNFCLYAMIIDIIFNGIYLLGHIILPMLWGNIPQLYSLLFLYRLANSKLVIFYIVYVSKIIYIYSAINISIIIKDKVETNLYKAIVVLIVVKSFNIIYNFCSDLIFDFLNFLLDNFSIYNVSIVKVKINIYIDNFMNILIGLTVAIAYIYIALKLNSKDIKKGLSLKGILPILIGLGSTLIVMIFFTFTRFYGLDKIDIIMSTLYGIYRSFYILLILYLCFIIKEWLEINKNNNQQAEC